MKLYYLLNKKPAKASNVLAWANWFTKNSHKRVVAKDEINGILISTVFLGIDRSIGRDSTPILFETMIFGGPNDLYQRRYHTLIEAETGHKEIVNKIKNNGTL